MAKKVVVVGGGFAGCGAAAAAARAGAEVTLLEMTDTLTGVGQVATHFARGEQFVAHEELKAMGAGDIGEALESTILHRNMSPEGNWYLRDCRNGPEAVEKALEKLGVKIIYHALASDVKMSGKKVTAVKLKDGTALTLDAIVDATGGTGPTEMCEKYSSGCVACEMMCPHYGGRISIAAKAGVKEYAGVRADGKTLGSVTDTLHAVKETLSPELQKALKEKGRVGVSIPKGFSEILFQRIASTGRRIRRSGKIGFTQEEAEMITIEDGGYARIGIPYITRRELKQIPGLENALIITPKVWWIPSAIRFMAISPRDNTLKAEGVDNLFVAGEKVGHLYSVTPCYATGAVAGHNAVRQAAGTELLELPRTTGIGELIAYGGELDRQDKMVSSVFLIGRLKEKGLYTLDAKKIHGRIKELGLSGILSQKLV